MKAKLKNANGFVRLLLNHGEKLGMVAVAVLAGLLIWKSLGREKLAESNQPQALQARVAEAKDKVEKMTWEQGGPEDVTNSSLFLAAASDVAMTPVPKEMGRPLAKINPPVVDEMKLRADPVLLAVENLEVNAGAGLWMSADPEVIREKLIAAAKDAARKAQELKEEQERLEAEAEEGGRGDRRGRGEREGRGEGYGDMMGGMGGKTKDGAIIVQPRGGAQMQGFEDIRERSWVTVLAKVPISQQFQMYTDALAGAGGFNPTNDAPEYLGYFVEREEVTEGGQGKWVLQNKGKPIRGADILSVMRTWPIQTPDLVTPKYIHPLLTFPLPPMVMREWGDEITNSELPIQTPEEIAEEELRAQEEALTPEEEEAEDADNPFASVIDRRTQPMMGGMEGGLRGERGMEGGGMRGGIMRGGMEGGRGMEGGGMRGGMMAGPTELSPYTWDGETKFLLFRYFDSTVTPGHRYRYRVRLAMIDVNAVQTPKYLAPDVAARLEKEKQAAVKAKKPAKPLGWRLSAWSEPSPVAVVPQPGLMFLANVKPPSQSNQNAEPEARVVIKSLDAVNAAEIALGDLFLRGSVLNRSQRAQIIWSTILKIDPAEDPIESPEFDFITGLTLVDFDGGEELTPKNRKLLAPARAMVMDSSGRLRLRNELEDEKVVREYDLIMAASKEQERRSRDRDGGGGEGRRGGEGGRGF